jgi:WD40 repeat protein
MMRSDDRGIARALNQILPDEDGELLVVIDQFEELFTHARDDEASKFIDGLIGAIREPRARLRVALTIRADFWDRPLRHPALAARLETAAVMVSPLAADELEAAIVEPARRQGASYEPGLVARVMADVGDEPGALPLLQYALTQLFDTNVSGLIRAGSYDEIGGLTGALAASAERTLTELTEPQQAATRRLLGRLVSLGEGTEDTRRRVRMSEFGDHRDTSAVIEAFGDARLLVFDHDPVTREPTVEIAHEALIRAWPRLRGWLDDDRDGLRIHRHLTETTSSWLASGRDAGELYRGGRLESTEAWAADHAADLNETEREFLAASAAVRDAEFEAERLHAEQQSRNNHRLRVLASIAVVVALLAAVAGVVALQQRSRADEQADEARVQAELAEVARQEAEANAADARDRAEEASNERDRADANADAAEAATVTADELRVAAEQQALVESTRRIGSLALSTIDDDIDLAVLLAIESASRAVESGREISEARQALFSTTAHHDIAARVALWDVDHTKHSLVAVAPSGTRFAALVAGEPASEVRHVEIRDLDGGSPVLVEIDDPTSVAWDPVGNRVLVGAEGGVIWAVDPATGAPTEFHRTGADWVKVWQMTDQWLVYQSGSGPVGGIATMTVASVADLRAVVEFERSIWLYVSPTGDHLVVSDGLSPGLYELPSGNLLAQVTIPAPMSWTADGDALLGITPDGVSFERLEVPSLSVSSIPTGLETAPTGLSLSPDGRLIAIGESDGAVRVFDADTFELGAEYFGHTDQVRAFDWTAAGDFLFSTDQPGGGDQVIVWDLDLAPRAPARVFPGSSDYPTWSAGHSDDERLVAVRRRDGSTSAELWSPGSVSTRFEGFQPVHARGADGAIVAASQRGVDGLATGFVVSDVSTGSVLLDVAGDLGAPLAISPDGQTVIATIGDGILFTVLNGGGSIEPEVAAIDVASGEVKWTLPGVRAFSETRTGHAAVFVDDGDAVVLATGSGLEWLEYDRPPELVAVATATGELLASRPLRSANAHLAASADGALLATADDRGGVSVLDVDAFLTGSRGPEVASTTLAAGTLPFGMAFSVDDGTLYTPAGFISPELLALDVDDGLALEWVLDTDLNESGTFPASQPTVDDGLIWFAAAATRSDQANRILEFGLVGIPTDLETYLAWARAIPTRDFTEAECEQLLGGPCADVLTRAD